ncbi:MAG: hypothetical protein V4736_03890 [Bdellovibrionota bacterium]
MKKLLGAIILTAASSAWAGKFEIIGEGAASTAAEFINLDISVVSECHSSALSARKAVDELAEQAVAALKPFQTEMPQQLQIAPGANIQQLKTMYIGNENVVICDEAHNWNSNTMIQFRVRDLQSVAAVQDALLVLNPPNVAAEAKNVVRLKLTLGKPSPGVFAETWYKMSDTALARAQQNALRQVMVLIQGTNQTNIELLKVKPTTSSSGQLIYDQVTSEGDTAGIGLGTVSVKLAREFTYKVGPN